MLLPTWTRSGLSSEAKSWGGSAWRLVEAQNVISTRKLVANVREQNILDEVLDDSKPLVPEACRHLDYLLFTPFRYTPYAKGSRFRKSGATDGVFYAAQNCDTAVAEIAYYRMAFYRDSPGLSASENAADYTAFQVSVNAQSALDLTCDPFLQYEQFWTHSSDYRACQELASVAREAGVEVILSRSVRDPKSRKNVNILSCSAFAKPKPLGFQTWRIVVNSARATAYCEHPRKVIEFDA